MTTTPNMNLILPVPTVTPGPDYAQQNNAAFGTVDSHDHTAGKGVQVPSEGINIDVDLTFNNQNAKDVNSVRFKNNPSALGGASDVNCAFVAGGELYYNNASGAPVQITAGGALNAASIGAIGGDYATSTASEFYVSPQDTFFFTSNTNIPANIDAGSVTVREVTTSPQGVTLQSPLALGASYNMILPTALPAGAKALSINASGQLATGVAGTVDATDLATDAVTTTKIKDAAVTAAKLSVSPNIKTERFIASTTWVVPAGVTELFVTGIGGGGGGGAGATISSIIYGGGGGGSGLMYTASLPVTPGNTLTITIGAGGSSGNQGGTTSITGGPAGLFFFGGYGGQNSTSQILQGPGGVGSSTGGTARYGAGGHGGFGYNGIGGLGNYSGAGLPAADNTGAGGGGGSGSGNNGGAGGSGILIVSYVQIT